MSDEELLVDVSLQRPISLKAAFECPPGAVLAIVGPSGSGKSTLLRGIAGLNTRLEGQIKCGSSIWLDSSAVRFLPPAQRKLGMVFQNYALFPHLTVLDNVMEGACRLPAATRKNAAMEWLTKLNMTGLEQRYPAQLSGGQQQRVALARALVGNPNLLLLDEPFASVDRITREKLYLEMASLRRSLQIPTVLVTHDVEEALMLADRLCLFAHGRVLQVDKPATILSTPQSGTVARLVGHRNIFRGQVIQHCSEKDRTIIEWRGIRLNAQRNERFTPGEQISWVIPRSQLLLFTPGRESKPRENELVGRVSESVILGDMVDVKVLVADPALPPMHLRLPLHVVNRRQIELGTQLHLTVEAEGICICANDK